MASQKTPGAGYTGKLGKTVTYPLNGKMVQRTVGANDGPPTDLQLRFRTAAPLIHNFLKSVKEFIFLGYSLESHIKKENAVNLAYKEIYHNALTGTYPEIEIDYAKVLMSKGYMTATAKVSAKVITDGIEFSWDTLTSRILKWNDIAMVLAYIPELESAEYLISGANRRQGYEIITLTDLPAGTVIHTYITFISANHGGISNSIYAGALTWV